MPFERSLSPFDLGGWAKSSAADLLQPDLLTRRAGPVGWLWLAATAANLDGTAIIRWPPPPVHHMHAPAVVVVACIAHHIAWLYCSATTTKEGKGRASAADDEEHGMGGSEAWP